MIPYLTSPQNINNHNNSTDSTFHIWTSHHFLIYDIQSTHFISLLQAAPADQHLTKPGNRHMYRLDIYDARSIFFQLSFSNLNLMVGKYWSWYNCSASGRAHLSTAASTVWICACKSTDWWPAEGCSLQLQPPWRLRRTSSYARGYTIFVCKADLYILMLSVS